MGDSDADEISQSLKFRVREFRVREVRGRGIRRRYAFRHDDEVRLR